ncbi:MAG: argininosuccinate lyase [Deltaproteobacteria bacterium]|nr:argininosuccinate lyase [Deltaproteobacteria bacterium]
MTAAAPARKPATTDRLWGGGYDEATHPLVQQLNASIGFDCRLAVFDIIGSVAHATMLRDQGILTAADHAAIVAGLRAILAEVEAGRFVWSVAREDVHMNVEAELRDRIGDPAGRLHTARSRNDQVALDERLYLRATLAKIMQDIARLVGVLAELGRRYATWPMPGYTHLQRAQPVTLGHHLLAHAEALLRDGSRLADLLVRMDACPLGSGALAGTTLPIDRAKTAQLLGFSGYTHNSLDAVSDRDHLVEALAAASLGMVHLSRIGEELVLYSSAEFGFVRLTDAFTTGSSLMPQKKNPDMAELLRGKSGRVVGDLVGLLVALKGLPLAYNKDLQEDKEPLFDALDTWAACLQVTADMLGAAKWNRQALLEALDRGFLLATDLADELVRCGVPFRTAHEQIAELVADCVRHHTTFARMGPAAIAQRLGVPAAGIAQALDVERSLNLRDLPGAPHPKRVRSEAARTRRASAKLQQQAQRWLAPCPAEGMLRGSDPQVSS